MIVLDEQLLGRGIERNIARWYRGSVQFIIDLRPDTVIKDDAIPTLLRQQPQPIFVTINERFLAVRARKWAVLYGVLRFARCASQGNSSSSQSPTPPPRISH